MEHVPDRPSLSLAQLELLARESADRLAARVEYLDHWSVEHESLELEPSAAPEPVEGGPAAPSAEELARRLRADFAAILLENFPVEPDRQQTGSTTLATH